MTTEMKEALEQFKKRFEDIKNAKRDSYIKSVRMAALMTDMENVFQIPIFGKERVAAFKKSFPEVIDFYREVSLARDL